MSLKSIAAQLVELCNQGKNFDLMRTLYLPAIISVEGDGSETAGQGPVIQKSEIWQLLRVSSGHRFVSAT